MSSKKNNISITGDEYVPMPSANSQRTKDHPITVPIADNPVPEDVRKADEVIHGFQSEIAEKAFAATLLSASMSAAFRREYLNAPGMVELQPLLPEFIKRKEIQWLKLMEVGMLSDFPPQECVFAIERLLQAFHAPGKYRLLFLVSSDAQRLTVRLGLQADGSYCSQDIPDELLTFVNDFAKANWPGLKFERETNVPSPILELDNMRDNKNIDKSAKDKVGHNIGLRVLTGLPALRNDKNTLPATLDKLMDALRGKRWSYLVIAEPVLSTEVNQYIYTCRDFAGRAESVKSLQIGKNLSDSIQKSFSQNYGRNQGTSLNESSRIRDIAAGGIALLPFVAMLGIACPLLLPVALASSPAIMGALGVVGGTSGILAGSILSRMVKGKGNQVSNGESYSEAISESVSMTRGVNLSETIVSKHAEAAAELLDAQCKRFALCESLGAWDVGTYFVGENESTADTGANVLKALFSGENSYYEPIRIYNPRPPHGLYDIGCDPISLLGEFQNPRFELSHNGVCIAHPLGERYNVLRTVLNTREILHLINFPMSNVPGIPVRKISPDTGLKLDAKENGLELGKQIFRGTLMNQAPYHIELNSLAKHVLVCGINGSGKTNTIKNILSELQRKTTPFLVIEPAKLEYVDWAIQENHKLLRQYGNEEKAKQDAKWINVYIPGRKKWKGQSLETLYLNPFDFVWLNENEDPKTLEHVDRLKTIINAALPMQEVLPILMEELIYAVYHTKFSKDRKEDPYSCWLPNDSMSVYPKFADKTKTMLPTFAMLSCEIENVFRKRHYGQEIQQNLKAALETRVQSFQRGWKKELLNREKPGKSEKDWEQLFTRPTVINLTSLTSDEDKAFFMAIIFLFIYEYRQELSELPTTSSGNADAKLKHLLVIEEAHRVLSHCEAASPLSASPKQKVSEMFSNMISEVRAYGQGILIADQIPERLNEDSIKNTNLKIVHKLVSADDRNAMATALNLWEQQNRIIGDLEVGEALVRGDMDKEAYLVKINKHQLIEGN